MSRRLPLYILIDVSEGVGSDSIKAINNGLREIVSSLKGVPAAVESLYLSIITIGKLPRQLCPLTALNDVEVPFVIAERGTGGASSLGAALRLVTECCEREVVKGTSDVRGDWRPVVFVYSGSRPTDDITVGVEIFKRRNWKSTVVVRLSKTIDRSVYEQITENVFDVEDMDPSVGQKFIFAEQIEAELADADIAGTGEGADVPASPGTVAAFKVPQAMFIRCPKCKESLELPREAVGKRVQCPFCKEVFTGRAEVLLVDFEMPEERNK